LGFWDIESFEDEADDENHSIWYNVSFESSSRSLERWLCNDSNFITNDDTFAELNENVEWRKQDEMTIERFEDIILYSNMSKSVTREYKRPKDRQIRKAYSLFYEYSETILGEDEKPRKGFEKNARVVSNIDDNNSTADDDYDTAVFQGTSSKREDPLVEVIRSKNEVKVVIEMPLVKKKDIKVNAYDGCLKVYTDNIQERKYRHVIDIPSDVDITSGKSTYRNGILEVVFRKKMKGHS
jgi:HSP20 family protein